MESHLVVALAFLAVGIMGGHAGGPPPEMYWKRVLPNSPMPKAVKDSLQFATGATVNEGNNGLEIITGKPGRKTQITAGKGGATVRIDPRGKPAFVVVQPADKPAFLYKYAANETQLHDNPNTAFFFLEKDLTPGTKINFHSTKSDNRAIFLPRVVSESIPFSSEKLPEILKELSVSPGSGEAKSIEQTIRGCEAKGVAVEEKYCATSLESMVDFAVSKLGRNVEAFSTDVERETRVGKYTVSGERKMAGGDEVVICHKQNYAYAVFYCHHTKSSVAYAVTLMGADETEVAVMAVCHADTSTWNPRHVAFQVLKITPGTVPVCHFLSKDDIVWVAK
ncbi:hypothetical protein Nepgr_014273 [Nepenthes gracilis]|uniref:BURP domain-containing protein n=1 Tax=Nepenthes gracilis TaxID=150966 RepID=A0AAD3XPD0_NEPGR|nr:hypothetical protein Nepgr_014273 [Nepenthes gracilis]